MMLNNKVAVIYGAGGAIGGAIARTLRVREPGSSSPGAIGHRSKQSPRKSFPPEDPPRLRRLTLSTSRRWTGICSQ